METLIACAAGVKNIPRASRRLLCSLFFLSTLVLVACDDGDEDSPTLPPGTHRVGSFLVKVDPSEKNLLAVTITHMREPEKVLWESIPGAGFVAAAEARARITENRGSFTIEDEILNLCSEQTLDEVTRGHGALILSGELRGLDCQVGYSMQFSSSTANQLRFTLRLVDAPPGFNRVFLRYASAPDEHFYGFGEQFTFLDMKGREVPILTQEQGIGRGKEPLTGLLNIFSPGSGGSWYTTYAAIPHYMTSLGRSLFLENNEVSYFNLVDAEKVEIKLFGPEMRGRILYGATPLELIQAYTSYTGRMTPLPDWMNEGAVVGMQGGTDQVYAKLELLKGLETPIGAFWLQDWVGKRVTLLGSQLWWNWEVDRNQYPGWEEMVEGLRDEGIRVLTYINPYLVDVAERGFYDRNLFREAEALGFLVKNQDGNTYPITNTTFDAGIVDITNPEAREWYKDVIKDQVLGIGTSGWMADYGEGLPFDAALFSGESPETYHNLYPEEWARLNREVLEEMGVEEDVVFFSRSGYTRSPGQSRLFWVGDQLVTFDGDDGLKSAIKGMLSGGLSGYSLNHSDIGGYTTITAIVLNYHRSKELLMRWIEMSAFTTVYRTHEGSQPERNVQFYTDEETLHHFARFAKVYRALAFYRRELMREAARKGYPVARHPMLHYPEDPNVFGLKYQWMLGSEFMIVPVVDEGDMDVNAYLPAGEWVHVWSGAVYDSPSGGRWHENIAAPMGEPAVFYKLGSSAGETFRANLREEGILSR